MDPLRSGLRQPEHIDALRRVWAEQHSLRIDGVLEPAQATALLGALRQAPHALVSAPPDNFAYLYWKRTATPAAESDPVLSSFSAWMGSGFVDWVSSWSGQALAPHPSREVTATLFGYGCYLDTHNDFGHGRRLAFVLGLTPEAWPAGEGGHLEFLSPDGAVERRVPGWNTLDIFDVTGQDRFHRIPILTASRERRAVSGWLYAAEGGTP